MAYRTEQEFDGRPARIGDIIVIGSRVGDPQAAIVTSIYEHDDVPWFHVIEDAKDVAHRARRQVERGYSAKQVADEARETPMCMLWDFVATRTDEDVTRLNWSEWTWPISLRGR